MTERLTLKQLSEELETLRTQMLEMEEQFEHKLKTALEKAIATAGSAIESPGLPEHGSSIDAKHRQRLIAEEAYLMAERRGFQGGDAAQDWARAEEVINHRLMQEIIRGETATPGKSPAAKKPAARKPAAKKPAVKKGAARKADTKPSSRAK